MAVDDTGCGIPEQRLSTIFERFATGANMGSGLGLSICHELTQRMGGSINIKSTEGKGTTVWVTLPCRSSEIIRK
jgi:signal transduction histidine kinase